MEKAPNHPKTHTCNPHVWSTIAAALPTPNPELFVEAASA